jgi:hypothetical protein
MAKGKRPRIRHTPKTTEILDFIKPLLITVFGDKKRKIIPAESLL